MDVVFVGWEGKKVITNEKVLLEKKNVRKKKNKK